MEDKDQFTKFEGLYWHVSKSMGLIWKKIFEQQFPGSQSYILFLLEKGGPQRMSDLSDALDITAGAVTSLSDKLIAGGFIHRMRDENDRRVVYLEISPKGEEALSSLRVEGRKQMETVFTGIADSEIKHLIRIFEEVSKNIEKL